MSPTRLDNAGARTQLLPPEYDVSVVDPLSDSTWDATVQRHPHANVFHSSAWCRVLQKTYGHRPFYLRFTQSGAPAVLVPLMEVRSCFTGRRGVSLPFSDFCDALHFEQGPQQQVFTTIEDFARQHDWTHFELRGDGFVPASAVPAISFYAHKLDLCGGPEAIHDRFRSSVQRALRKPQPSGLSVEVSQSEQSMREFFHLHSITRARHGLPPQPFSFFLNIHREIVAQDLGSVVLVRLERQAIAAMVFFHWGKLAIYKFGASEKAYQHLRPNNLAMWEGIRLLAARGFETLHFGRSSIGNEGLRRFKLSWGAAEQMLHYYRYDAVRKCWNTTRDRTEGLHTRLFRLLPAPLNRLAGRVIYSHLD